MPKLLLTLLFATTVLAAESTAPTVSVVLLDQNGKTLPAQTMEKVIKTDAQWREQLGNGEVYTVTRGKGTERPFCGALHDSKQSGIYYCVCCDLPLFRSDAKFDSGTGWPSFWQEVPGAVDFKVDRSIPFMSRTEEHCAVCGGHLGHVFDDGPRPTGKRHCINSAALEFVPKA